MDLTTPIESWVLLESIYQEIDYCYNNQ